MQAPAVARLQAAKAQLGLRRDQIVAALHAELEELFAHLHADEVRHPVLALRGAAAVAEIAGEGRVAAGAQLAAEDVLLGERLFLRHFAFCSIYRFKKSASGSISSQRCGRFSRPASSAGRCGSRPSAARRILANLTGSAVSRKM